MKLFRWNIHFDCLSGSSSQKNKQLNFFFYLLSSQLICRKRWEVTLTKLLFTCLMSWEYGVYYLFCNLTIPWYPLPKSQVVNVASSWMLVLSICFCLCFHMYKIIIIFVYLKAFFLHQSHNFSDVHISQQGEVFVGRTRRNIHTIQ